MPNDSLRQEVEPVRRAALAYIAANRSDANQRRLLLGNLHTAESRLSSELEERGQSYLADLDRNEHMAIEAKRAEVEQNPNYQRAFQRQKAAEHVFEHLRRINGGAFPWNISPVLYIIPLIFVGIAEWYVNYSTFASIFIPVFAIAATLIVAAVFAWASHLHGAYLKQISEIIHPSVEYRNVIGRKIALLIATLLLVAAFITVIWLRWLVIAGQLGVSNAVGTSTFGGANSSMIWSRVGPTIIVNLLIWGLGVLYSWTLHERVPELREKYREYLRASKSLDKKMRPFISEEKKIKAQFDREREENKIAVAEYKALLDDIRSTMKQIQEHDPA